MSSGELETQSALAGPPALPSGIANDDRVGRYILRYNRSSSNQRVLANDMAADDRRIGSNARSALYQAGDKILFCIARKRTTRSEYIREDHRRATKNVVLQGYALIDGHVVLDLHVGADRNPWPNDDILPDAASCADPGSRQNVTEVPDLSAFPDFYVVVDVGGFVYEALVRISHGRARPIM
jgi:hypothetical protein